jgi:outer membrane protein OmpA-like peptidoglycan-associated protein
MQLRILTVLISIFFLLRCHVLVIDMENKGFYPQLNKEVSQKYGTVLWGKYEVSKPREISCQNGIQSIIIQRTLFDFVVHYVIGGLYTMRSVDATCLSKVDAEDIGKNFSKNKKLSLNSVYFNKNSAEILVESHNALDQVATFLSKEKFTQLIITGHTDLTGAVDKNKILSQSRSEAVKMYLSGKGILANKIFAKGVGSSQPLVNSIDEESNARNRRIEFGIE